MNWDDDYNFNLGTSDANNYQYIICKIANVNLLYQYIVDEINESLVVLSDTSVPETRTNNFKRTFSQAKDQVAQLIMGNNTKERMLLTSLNRYIESKHGDLNTFLESNNIVVPQYIHTISSTMGWNIPSHLIGNCNE